jgi:endonuclease YncB( thermonuclease family)
MKKEKPRKPGKGYWQQRDSRRRATLRRRNHPVRIILIGLLIGGIAGYFLFDFPSDGFQKLNQLATQWESYKSGGSNNAALASHSVRFSVCISSVRITCVVDGDTIWLNGTKIRIADIDTPEIFHPRCSHEEALGHRATSRLVELLNAGAVSGGVQW